MHIVHQSYNFWTVAKLGFTHLISALGWYRKLCILCLELGIIGIGHYTLVTLVTKVLGACNRVAHLGDWFTTTLNTEKEHNLVLPLLAYTM